MAHHVVHDQECAHQDQHCIIELRQCCTTIRKAMVEIITLSSGPKHPLVFNQLTRWIATKEDHADRMIDRMSQYFLCQRAIPYDFAGTLFLSEEEYRHALASHHRVLTVAVSVKQATALPVCDRLDHAVEELARLYLSIEVCSSKASL